MANTILIIVLLVTFYPLSNEALLTPKRDTAWHYTNNGSSEKGNHPLFDGIIPAASPLSQDGVVGRSFQMKRNVSDSSSNNTLIARSRRLKVVNHGLVPRAEIREGFSRLLQVLMWSVRPARKRDTFSQWLQEKEWRTGGAPVMQNIAKQNTSTESDIGSKDTNKKREDTHNSIKIIFSLIRRTTDQSSSIFSENKINKNQTADSTSLETQTSILSQGSDNSFSVTASNTLASSSVTDIDSSRLLLSNSTHKKMSEFGASVRKTRKARLKKRSVFSNFDTVGVGVSSSLGDMNDDTHELASEVGTLEKKRKTELGDFLMKDNIHQNKDIEIGRSLVKESVLPGLARLFKRSNIWYSTKNKKFQEMVLKKTNDTTAKDEEGLSAFEKSISISLNGKETKEKYNKEFNPLETKDEFEKRNAFAVMKKRDVDSADSPNFNKSTDSPNLKKSSDSPYLKKSADSPNLKKSPDSPYLKKSADSPNLKKSPDSPYLKKSADSPNLKKSADLNKDDVHQAPFNKRSDLDSPNFDLSNILLNVEQGAFEPNVKPNEKQREPIWCDFIDNTMEDQQGSNPHHLNMAHINHHRIRKIDCPAYDDILDNQKVYQIGNPGSREINDELDFMSVYGTKKNSQTDEELNDVFKQVELEVSGLDNNDWTNNTSNHNLLKNYSKHQVEDIFKELYFEIFDIEEDESPAHSNEKEFTEKDRDTVFIENENQVLKIENALKGCNDMAGIACQKKLSGVRAIDDKKKGSGRKDGRTNFNSDDFAGIERGIGLSGLDDSKNGRKSFHITKCFRNIAKNKSLSEEDIKKAKMNCLKPTFGNSIKQKKNRKLGLDKQRVKYNGKKKPRKISKISTASPIKSLAFQTGSKKVNNPVSHGSLDDKYLPWGRNENLPQHNFSQTAHAHFFKSKSRNKPNPNRKQKIPSTTPYKTSTKVITVDHDSKTDKNDNEAYMIISIKTDFRPRSKKSDPKEPRFTKSTTK